MSESAKWQRPGPLSLAIRAGWGTTLVIAPGGVLRVFGGVDEGDAPRRVMRVLGARHLIQAAAESQLGGRAREFGIVVDLLHGATSVGFAFVRPSWRRAALTDAAVAVGFALLGFANS